MTKTTKGIITAVAMTLVAFATYVVVERRKSTKKDELPSEVEEEAR